MHRLRAAQCTFIIGPRRSGKPELQELVAQRLEETHAPCEVEFVAMMSQPHCRFHFNDSLFWSTRNRDGRFRTVPMSASGDEWKGEIQRKPTSGRVRVYLLPGFVGNTDVSPWGPFLSSVYSSCITITCTQTGDVVLPKAVPPDVQVVMCVRVGLGHPTPSGPRWEEYVKSKNRGLLERVMPCTPDTLHNRQAVLRNHSAQIEAATLTHGAIPCAAGLVHVVVNVVDVAQWTSAIGCKVCQDARWSGRRSCWLQVAQSAHT